VTTGESPLLNVFDIFFAFEVGFGSDVLLVHMGRLSRGVGASLCRAYMNCSVQTPPYEVGKPCDYEDWCRVIINLQTSFGGLLCTEDLHVALSGIREAQTVLGRCSAGSSLISADDKGQRMIAGAHAVTLTAT
jgi:hypothetical protein